jgi:DNA (cytosine-5)-methyltransferase 1
VADDLWPEMRRIVADVAPRYVFTENVQKRAIDKAADELEQMGYTVRCVALSAADVGADHIRKRYWLAAHADNDSKLQRTVDAEASDMSGVRCSVWQTEPDQSGMAYGVAHRVDRLSAIGNGQVPAVVRLAWETLNHRTPVASQSGGHLSQPTAGAR